MASSTSQFDGFHDLPNEIYQSIFSFLEKKDLKSVRSCSKFFSIIVIELLFDRIYVSPHSKNLEVFTQMTDHASISKKIKHLIYGSARFEPNMSYELYRDMMLWRTATSLDRADYKAFFDKNHRYPQDFIEIVQRYRDSCRLTYYRDHADALEGLAKPSILTEGFEDHLRMIDEQQENILSGKLMRRLCSGLPKLPLLKTVSYENDWDLRLPRKFSRVKISDPNNPEQYCPSGSPLARSYNPWYLQPTDQCGKIRESNFFDLVRALALTKREVKTLDLDNVLLGSENFDDINVPSFIHTTNAFRYLHSLSLLYYVNRQSQTDALPRMLQSIGGLRHVQIRIAWVSWLSYGASDYKHLSIFDIFGMSFVWPHLSSIILENARFMDDDLIEFLRIQPKLCTLHLKNATLENGSWIDFFDNLHNLLNLKSFLLSEMNWRLDKAMEEAIQQFVLCGETSNPLRGLSEDRINNSGVTLVKDRFSGLMLY